MDIMGLLVLNSTVSDQSQRKAPLMSNCDGFFVVNLYMYTLLDKQSWGQWTDMYLFSFAVIFLLTTF